MDDQTLILAAALLLSLIGVAFAAYELGHWRGQRAGHDAQQCADELGMVADARGRHPAGRAHTEPPSNLDRLDGLTLPADRHPDPLTPGVGSAGRSTGTYTDELAP